MELRKKFADFFMITLGTAICAAGVYFLLIPSGLSVGSISGLAIIISKFIPLPVSTITLILNVGLLLLGFLLIGRDFGAKTVYTSVIIPGFLAVFERFFPEQQSIMGDVFVDMVCYLFVVSVGQAILFTHNASSGGWTSWASSSTSSSASSWARPWPLRGCAWRCAPCSSTPT